MSLKKEVNRNGGNQDNLHLLLEGFTSLNRAAELQTVLNKSIEIIKSVMKSEASSLMLLDKKTGDLVVSLPTGPVRDEIRGKRIAEGEGISGWVLKNGEPYYSNNPEESQCFAGEISDNFTTQNIICVPLTDKKGKVFGVLQALNRFEGAPFVEEDIPVFEALANHISLAITRSRELESLQHDLQNREMMLTEVHHRIKNNLTTLTALIEMEISEITDETAQHVLKKTCSRIESMTEVHNLLYSKDWDQSLNLGAYLQRLTTKILSVLSNPSQDVTVNIEADSILIDTERAMSCGLLVNELLVNAYKHAFKDQVKDGLVQIRLTEESNNITLKFSDNGDGIAGDFSLKDGGSVGSWLIKVLLRRLNATANVTGTDGIGFVIRFEK